MASIQKITPCLWFDRDAGAAADLYVATFAESRIVRTSHYGEGAPLPKGTVLMVDFELAGQRFQAFNGGPKHAGFTEAISMSISCEGQAEVDHFWDALSAGGKPGRCGWLKDRFGLSWQVVPTALGRLMGAGDAERSRRVMGAMMGMSKLDVAALQSAYDG